MKLTKSQKRYLILLKAGNMLRVDKNQLNVRIRGYDLRIQFRTFERFRRAGLVEMNPKFNRADQPDIRYYTITEEGSYLLEESFK